MLKNYILGILLFLSPLITFAEQDSIKIESAATTIELTEDALSKPEIGAAAFKNIYCETEDPGVADVSWSLDYKVVNEIDKVVIRYKQKLLKSDPWKYITVDAKEVNFKVKDLIGGLEYKLELGVSKNGKLESDIPVESNENISWTKEYKFKPASPYSWYSFIVMIGALGFFIYGMKIMSDGIQKIAGDKMRQILSRMTSSRVGGVFTGFAVTSVIQSSSATTVMVVSFVNAGLLTLIQAIGVIMGANIGTTVTGWLVSFFGFKVSISALALPLFAIAFPLLFSKKIKTKSIAEFIIGFALLFMGLDFLKESMPNIHSNPELFEFLTSYSGTGIGSVLFATMVGTIITIIIQSSSAAMALTLVLCNQGYISFEMAAGMILGENIGTTITANLAALVANVHAKRAALAHTVFNLTGVLWMIFAFPLVLKAIDYYCLTYLTEGSPFTTPEARPVALSIFHTGFNIMNTLLLVWFVKPIEQIVVKILPSKGKLEEEFRLEYIQTGVINAPELALVEAKKEVVKYGQITAKMSGMVQTLLTERDKKTYSKVLEKVKKYEEITDRLEVEIANYLAKVSENEISVKASTNARAMLSISNDLERIGDLFYQMSKVIERKNQDKIYFTPEQRQNITTMYKLVDEGLDIMKENLHAEYDLISLDKAKAKEKEINQLRNRLRQEHLSNIENGSYPIKSGQVYMDLISYCEKVGDHMLMISEAVAGQI